MDDEVNDGKVEPSADLGAQIRASSAPNISPELVTAIQALVQRAVSPSVRTSLARIASQAAEVSRRAAAAIKPMLAQLRPALEALVQVALASAVHLQHALPANWAQLNPWPDAELIERLLVDEGLALAWVPPPAMLQRLIDAEDAATRRVLIGRQWSNLVDACEVQLDAVTTKRLGAYVEFAREAAAAVRNGTPAAAQALNASILDTLLRRNFDAVTLRALIGAKRPAADMDRYAIREAIVLLGIYGAYTSWWPTQTEPAPKSFSRHMSAHGVSRRQYNRINSVISLMHVTALLRHLEGEARRTALMAASARAGADKGPE